LGKIEDIENKEDRDAVLEEWGANRGLIDKRKRVKAEYDDGSRQAIGMADGNGPKPSSGEAGTQPAGKGEGNKPSGGVDGHQSNESNGNQHPGGGDEAL
jgi:hypothetical protein